MDTFVVRIFEAADGKRWLRGTLLHVTSGRERTFDGADDLVAALVGTEEEPAG